MRLHKLHIKNFRKIECLMVTFPPGLSVIIGENNSGKTAIIDALRLMLYSGRDFDALRLNEDDFRRETGYAPIEIHCIFCDLNEDDEVHFLDCLVDIGDGKFEMRLNARAEFNATTSRTNIRMWGGETEGGSLPSNLYDRLNSIYLKPLRDPESGLRPGKHSQVSRLIDCHTEEKKHEEFETITRDANEKIRALDSIKSAKSDIDTQMLSIAGSQLTQKTELMFSDPKFRRIIAGLQLEIEGLPFSLNGLGYNNLIFTAATLGTLKKSSQFSFQTVLVEEPEAHLHPHLQVLLLRHLAKVAGEKDGNVVQVISSSHSPVLASQAPIDSIISVHQLNGKVSTVSVCAIEYDSTLKNKLQRYLNATRAELFFARRILMVEGISESLLLPVLARFAGGSLEESAVTVLNTDGINFNAFLPLFGTGKLSLPVVILTDGDDIERSGNPSASTIALKAREREIENLRVEYGQITFEHELASSARLLPIMLEAFEALHPINGAALKIAVSQQGTDGDKADAFHNEFIRNKTSKGKFAQELAELLQTVNLGTESVPQYIRDALSYLGVTNDERQNEPSGNATGTTAVPESDR